ncbi:hypothetical protein ACFL3V_00595 [Nanoarchaeota archaeon]
MKRVAFHGTRNLSEIIHNEAIVCPSLQTGEALFERHSEIYNRLVREFAEKIKDKLREQGKSLENEPYYAASNRTDYILADIVMQNYHFFGVSGDAASRFKEMRRGVNVFLSNYLVAANYAQGLEKGVLECVIDYTKVTSQLDNGWTLFPGRVGLDDVRCVYVEPFNSRRVRTELRKKGYDTPVRDINRRVEVSFNEVSTLPSQPYR